MPGSLDVRTQDRRAAMRAAGLRPVEIWVPDTRRPGFAEECRRQAEMVASADAQDTEHSAFMDCALGDLGTPR